MAGGGGRTEGGKGGVGAILYVMGVGRRATSDGIAPRGRGREVGAGACGEGGGEGGKEGITAVGEWGRVEGKIGITARGDNRERKVRHRHEEDGRCVLFLRCSFFEGPSLELLPNRNVHRPPRRRHVFPPHHSLRPA
jgi:hypothetical protein